MLKRSENSRLFVDGSFDGFPNKLQRQFIFVKDRFLSTLIFSKITTLSSSLQRTDFVVLCFLIYLSVSRHIMYCTACTHRFFWSLCFLVLFVRLSECSSAFLTKSSMDFCLKGYLEGGGFEIDPKFYYLYKFGRPSFTHKWLSKWTSTTVHLRYI